MVCYSCKDRFPTKEAQEKLGFHDPFKEIFDEANLALNSTLVRVTLWWGNYYGARDFSLQLIVQVPDGDRSLRELQQLRSRINVQGCWEAISASMPNYGMSNR